MKLILTLLFSSLFCQLFAQDKNLLLKINYHYIFADTNGTIPIPTRFLYVSTVDYEASEYLVQADGKWGVVKNNAYLFPCEYYSISTIYLEHKFKFHAYYLVKDDKCALATSDGSIKTPFEYDQILNYGNTTYSKKKGTDEKRAFLELIKDEKISLWYIGKNNEVKELTPVPVDQIEDAYGVFVLRNGIKEAVFEFDEQTSSLKEIIPFSNKKIYLRPDFYCVLDSVAKNTKVYSYDHQLKRKLAGLNSFEETNILEEYEIVQVEDNEPVVAREGFPDLKAARSRLDRLHNKNVLQAFQVSDVMGEWEYLIRNYQGNMEVSGEKGAWEVKVAYRFASKNPQKDTVLNITADQLLLKHPDNTGIIITQVGKLKGAVDSRGNVILPPSVTNLEIIRSTNSLEWLLVREKRASLLLFYDPLRKQLDTVLIGEPKDTYWIDQNQHIWVKRPEGKKKTREKLVTYRATNAMEKMMVFDNKQFYDSIVPDQSFAYFFHVYDKGKCGVVSTLNEPVVPCSYDSICLRAYFFVENSRYVWYREYKTLQPIISAYSNGKQIIYHPTGDPNSVTMNPAFLDGSLPSDAVISDDARFVKESGRAQYVEIYAINGQKLSKEPIEVNMDNVHVVSYNGDYWYIQGKDVKGNRVLVGRNGAWFVLPVK